MWDHVSQNRSVTVPRRKVAQTTGGLILSWSHCLSQSPFLKPRYCPCWMHPLCTISTFQWGWGNVSLMLRCSSSRTLTAGLPTLTRQIQTGGIALSISKIVWSEGLIIFEQLSWTLLRTQFPFQLAFLLVQGRAWEQGSGTSQPPPYGSIFSNVHKFPRV